MNQNKRNKSKMYHKESKPIKINQNKSKCIKINQNELK